MVPLEEKVHGVLNMKGDSILLAGNTLGQILVFDYGNKFLQTTEHQLFEDVIDVLEKDDSEKYVYVGLRSGLVVVAEFFHKASQKPLLIAKIQLMGQIKSLCGDHKCQQLFVLHHTGLFTIVDLTDIQNYLTMELEQRPIRQLLFRDTFIYYSS